jgi:hypothetical protein
MGRVGTERPASALQGTVKRNAAKRRRSPEPGGRLAATPAPGRGAEGEEAECVEGSGTPGGTTPMVTLRLSQNADCGKVVEPPERIAVVELIAASDSVEKFGKPVFPSCEPESVNAPTISENESASLGAKSPTSTEIDVIAWENVSRNSPPDVLMNGLRALLPQEAGKPRGPATIPILAPRSA